MPYNDPDYPRKWRANNKAYISAYNKEYRMKKPRNRKGIWDTYNLQRSYNISKADYLAMSEKQGGVCAICQRPEQATRGTGASIRLSVDHDHKTHIVRGLLCQKCNAAVGMLDDSVALAQSLIDYLNQHTYVKVDTKAC